jgi:threonine dehydrogenase-like Zn-dependent dehydrogenase
MSSEITMKAVRLYEFGGPESSGAKAPIWWWGQAGGDDLQLIRDFTCGEGVDAAVELTGQSDLMRLCIDALCLGGTFCPVGGEMRAIPLSVIDMVSKLLEKRRIAVPIHAVLPLSRAAEAHAILENGSDLVGRIVLHPWDE